MIELELQIATEAKTLPHPGQFREWIAVAYAQFVESGEMVIRIVDEFEMTELNAEYRGKEKPTNVLSFPAEAEPGFGINIIGDIVICAPVVEKEALEQNKNILGHWAHLVVHGALHLIGYDHIEEDDALEMEQLETEIMVNLGFEPPYSTIVATEETAKT